MNINKIEDFIKKEETEYLNKRKDYSVFSQHFNFIPFLGRHGVNAILSSPFFSFLAMIIFEKFISSSYSMEASIFFLSLFVYIGLFYSIHKLYYKMKFFTKQEADIRKLLIEDFDDKKISDSLLNHLKIELSEEQYIELMIDNENVTYKDVKKLVKKESLTQKIKDSKLNVILTSDEITEYSKNHKEITINNI